MSRTGLLRATFFALAAGALAMKAPGDRPQAPGKAAPQDDFTAIHAGLESAASSDCLACHATEVPRVNAHASHPIDRAYTGGAGRRSREEVERTGIALPGGQMVCLTCHDLRSPWKRHLWLPAGAKIERTVDRGARSTLEDEPAAPQPGSEVSRKPLCLVCHAF